MICILMVQNHINYVAAFVSSSHLRDIPAAGETSKSDKVNLEHLHLQAYLPMVVKEGGSKTK